MPASVDDEIDETGELSGAAEHDGPCRDICQGRVQGPLVHENPSKAGASLRQRLHEGIYPVPIGKSLAILVVCAESRAG